MLRRLLCFAAFLLFAAPAYAACGGSHPNWTAAQVTDITNCFAQGGWVEGDTITLATGTLALNATITITTHAFTLTGTSCTTGTVHGKTGIPTSCGTIISLTGLADGNYAFNLGLPASSDGTVPTIRISNIQFTGSTTNTFPVFNIDGCGAFDARTIRMDHVYFDNVPATAWKFESVLGLVDHSRIESVSAGQQVFISQNKGNVFNTCPTNTQGDGGWAYANNFGTSHSLYYEDNVFVNNSVIFPMLTAIDTFDGGRFVFRYNYISGGSVEGHGREGGTRTRGIREIEVYNNTFVSTDSSSRVIFDRGGTMILHNNTLTGYSSPVFNLLNFMSQEQANAPFGGADGRNVWNENHASNPFTTGTCTSVGTYTCTITGTNGADHAWVGYTFRRTSGVAVASVSHVGAAVTVNTIGAHGFTDGWWVTCWGADQYVYNNAYIISVVDSDTFQYTTTGTPSAQTGAMQCARGSNFSLIDDSAASGGNTTFTLEAAPNSPILDIFPAASMTFEINQVLRDLDQVGLGAGTDLAGAGIPTATSLAGESTSPAYQFLNGSAVFAKGYAGVCGGVSGTCVYPTLTANRDYYDYAGSLQTTSSSPFSGVTGVGVGTAARKPSTCTTGVFYWDTDNGFGYQCTATNTWTQNYTPYTHPYAFSGACSPDHLAFPSQPGSVAVNVALGTVTVGIYDSGNNLCPSATDTITIANKGGTCIGMNLGGTKSGAASGSFTTTNLTEDVVGACTLSATASGLTGADSSAFTISAAGTGGGIGARTMLRIR